jgi:hypothetical protein
MELRSDAGITLRKFPMFATQKLWMWLPLTDYGITVTIYILGQSSSGQKEYELVTQIRFQIKNLMQ